MNGDSSTFDVGAPLPTGLTVLEASAGTGKTWAIAALAVRYLADGLVDAQHLLAVTFTHLASADLRTRLYERLLETSQLAELRASGTATPPNSLVDAICDGPALVVDARLARLRQAIGDFDAATVATIHEFCRRATELLGPLGTRSAGRIDDERASVLADQTVADLTLATLLGGAEDLSAQAYTALGRAALANPELPIVPSDDAAGRFATACRQEYARRKLRLGIDDFDDLALRLDAILRSDQTGAGASDALADRFHVVLVDEFQDTDPVQWSILRRAFAGRRPLVLVGDPKQSIYAFRGADVHAYLEAVTEADTKLTLPVNYRSDQAVVEGINQVFAGADFGQPDAPIPMRTSRAAHQDSRLRPMEAGLELRQLFVSHNKQRAAIDADLVSWVSTTLSGHQQLCDANQRWRPLRADDIAVLVSSNRHGEAINQALREAGVPSVFSGVASVFASPGAEQWLVLLDALAHPREATLRRAMVGDLIGLPLSWLAQNDDQAITAWAVRLRGWAASQPSPSAILGQLEDQADLSARLVGLPDGERLLTDIRHLAELLTRQVGTWDPGELLVWLRAQRRRAVEFGGGDRTRRLETDRLAVNVLTVHAAKGLEFPIVLVPATADAARHSWGSPDYPMLWREQGQRLLDTRSSGPGQVKRWQGWCDEQAAEERRRLYVATTRGASLVVAWLGDKKAAFTQLAAPLPHKPHPGIRFVRVDQAPAATPGPRPVQPMTLTANTFSRTIDATWVRTSYSGLTAGLHDFVAAGADDEPALPSEPATTVADGSAPISPMSDLAAGAGFGTIVHGVLEACDPASPNLADELVGAALAMREHSTLPNLDTAALAAALVEVVNTPLGPMFDNNCLVGLGTKRRLAELGFEMPLGNAGAWESPASTVHALADLFSDPTLVPADDPLAAYGNVLLATTASQQVLRGFLTGSIDLIVELPGGKVMLADYKTNRLGPFDAPDPVSAYSREAMAKAMLNAHYPLQALLYSVALRRYLAWRRPNVPFERQWAGVAYLFVRGMAGPTTPLSGGMPCGVFGWYPSPALIKAADDVLRGEAGR